MTALLFGPPDGLSSPRPGDVEAASQALGSCLAAAGLAAHEAALPGLRALLDRGEHDALTKHDVEGAPLVLGDLGGLVVSWRGRNARLLVCFAHLTLALEGAGGRLATSDPAPACRLLACLNHDRSSPDPTPLPSMAHP